MQLKNKLIMPRNLFGSIRLSTLKKLMTIDPEIMPPFKKNRCKDVPRRPRYFSSQISPKC